MEKKTWYCPKCNSMKYEEDRVTMTGTGFSRFLNVQNRKFLTVTCMNCKYTELFKGEMKAWENVLDFFGN